jgi:hypothetical protein
MKYGIDVGRWDLSDADTGAVRELKAPLEGPAECVIGAAAQNVGPADVIDGPADGSNVGFQRVMERPGGIRAARSEVVYEGNIDGLPARLERELQLVSVKNIAVEVAGVVKEKEIVDRMARGVLGFGGTGKKGEQKEQ